MITMSRTAQHRRRHLIGIAALTMAGTALIAAPPANAAHHGGRTRCTLSAWYVLNNPSIVKLRGDQSTVVPYRVPTGPCPASRH